LEQAVAVTIADIARRAGVTKTTVSKVLNRSRSTVRISEPTRQRIFEAVRDLNYRPSFSARCLARGRTFSIGFVCGNIHMPHYAELAALALREAEKRGYHLLISVTEWKTGANDLECLDGLLGRGVDGTIFFGNALQPGTRQYEQMVAEEFPVVLCVQDVDGLSSVISDWRPGVDEAVAHLKQRGHQTICFVGPSDPDCRGEKTRALREACDRHRMEVHHSRLDTWDVGVMERHAEELVRRSDRPTAVVAHSDHTAGAIAWGIHRAGLTIPDNVALLGMDGTQAGRYYWPPLTTVAQDRENMIRAAVEMVVNMIEKKEGPGRRVSFPTRLIVREST